ncbi:hypothetical protein TrLO_g13688 [Triparma laevis f. longispina]|uniref:Uncharacterized protein n=1 Tax=Triparma laevis f. longispina TaxID=1714387 RepID=A0A9W6ZNZ9_9STRA|nr:hypothetical protein TrLO_g13688 [Triparma laevis f. longispina]
MSSVSSFGPSHSGSTITQIWEAFHTLVVNELYPWDREYLDNMPVRREDKSIFVSVASYRDENCLSTLTGAYSNSFNPKKLNFGITQQNCVEDCKSGVLEGGKVEDVEPDEDCYEEFCKGKWGEACEDGRVRVLKIKEFGSLGPYFARFLGSKLWNGESYYLQIDSHMTFAPSWDLKSIQMLTSAPSKKPVITTYPPPHTTKFKGKGTRICDPLFAPSDIEKSIIRLAGSQQYDKVAGKPRVAPFVAAGYFVAHSGFLSEVPFDPFLPWIFMGEEISMSARLWTAGYDLFSPNQDVTGHIYVRRHTPKFWEVFQREFHSTGGGHNSMQLKIIDRIKYTLGYPEAARHLIRDQSILTAVEEYGMGGARPLEDYLEMVGLDMVGKKVTPATWCHTGVPPPLHWYDEIRDQYK